MWAGPLFDGHVCSIGYEVVDFIESYCCHGPGDIAGQPAVVDDEWFDFIIESYRINPETGRRVYDEGVLSRPKGRAKTELAGWLAVAEGYGPVRFSHWDENGQPVGRRVASPLIRCLATEGDQAGNTFEVIAYIVGEWGKEHYSEIYGGSIGMRNYQSASGIYIPGGGEFRLCTSGSASKDGGKETFVVADETHLYVLKLHKDMYATVRRNCGKRAIAQPWLLQTTTMYRSGENSTAEETFVRWKDGKLTRTLVDHREAAGKVSADTLADREYTKKQLAEVYGPAAKWHDLDRKYDDMRDPRICRDDADAARYYLNREITYSSAWIAKELVRSRMVDWTVTPGDRITLGFDGSINDDSTVLFGCRMSDGFLFPIGIWEKPKGRDGIGWEVPVAAVLSAFEEAFDVYDVVRAYFDPHEWRSEMRELAKLHGPESIISWETYRDRQMSAALDRLHTDIVKDTVKIASNDAVLDHFANARIRRRGSMTLICKESPKSEKKIDSVVGCALALEARADVLTAEVSSRSGKALTRVHGRVVGS